MTFVVDTWSQYDNPEEGNKQEGDIKEWPQSRKVFTRYQELLWPNGIVKYHLDTRIGEHYVEWRDHYGDIALDVPTTTFPIPQKCDETSYSKSEVRWTHREGPGRDFLRLIVCRS